MQRVIIARDWTYCHTAESSNQDEDEAAQSVWDDGDCGGFECFMPAEEEDNPEVVAAYDPEADDSSVLNVPAGPNRLSLVLGSGSVSVDSLSVSTIPLRLLTLLAAVL